MRAGGARGQPHKILQERLRSVVQSQLISDTPQTAPAAGNLVYEVERFFCLQLKISTSTEPIELSIVGKLHIVSRMVKEIQFLDLCPDVILGFINVPTSFNAKKRRCQLKVLCCKDGHTSDIEAMLKEILDLNKTFVLVYLLARSLGTKRQTNIFPLFSYQNYFFQEILFWMSQI